MRQQAGAIGVDPLAQDGPALDQRLMRNLDVTLARMLLVPLGGDQPSVNQPEEDGVEGLGAILRLGQLPKRGPAFRILGPLSGLGQAEEDPATELAFRIGEAIEDLVGPVLQRAM